VKNDPRVELSSRLRETSVADAHPDVEGSEMIHHPPKAARYANHSRHSVTEQRTEDTRSAVRCAGIPQGREIASRATWARASLDKLARALPREFRLTRDRRRVAERSEKRERERERERFSSRSRSRRVIRPRDAPTRQRGLTRPEDGSSGSPMHTRRKLTHHTHTHVRRCASDTCTNPATRPGPIRSMTDSQRAMVARLIVLLGENN